MRRSLAVVVPALIFVCAAALAAAAAATPPPGHERAAMAVLAPASGRSAQVEDAQPLPATPYHGVLLPPDYRGLWTYAIGGGQQVIVELLPPDGEDFRLALWPPGTLDFGDASNAVASSQDPFDPQALKYVAPSSGGGTYYIGVWSHYSSVDTGSYELRVDLQSPTNSVRVTAPNVPRLLRLNRDYTSWGTLSPRHMPGDESVTVEWQKYTGGRWRSESSERVENEDYGSVTRFRVQYSFFGWGSGKVHWRLRAVHRADDLHPRKTSAWRYFWVKV